MANIIQLKNYSNSRLFITTKDPLNCKCDKLLLVSYMEGLSPEIGPSHGDHELSFQTFSTSVPAIKP